MPLKRGSTDEEIERRFSTLPDAVADAFESEHTARTIFDAGRELGLPIDKIGEVAKLVGYAMLGLVTPAEFVPGIHEIIGDRGKAERLAATINQQVFLPIREVMKQTYGAGWADEAPRGAAPAPGAPSGARQGPPAAKPAPPPPVTSKPPVAETPPQVRKLEPLIIRPLPSSPQLSRERLIGTLPATPGLAPAPKPAPMPVAPHSGMPAPQTAALPHAPNTPSAPPVTKPAAVPVSKPISPRRETAPGEPPAPIISPLGITPPPPSQRSEGTWRGQVPPPLAAVPKPESAKPEPPKPLPAPAAAYDRMKEAVALELAALKEKDQLSKPAEPPAPSEAKAAPRAPTPPPPGVTTKEELRREIEKFQTPADGGPRAADSASNAPPSTPPALKPLKLPQEKIPKPQAPEQYSVDPYKEAVE